jgi:hypothetical protein
MGVRLPEFVFERIVRRERGNWDVEIEMSAREELNNLWNGEKLRRMRQ